MLENKHNLTVDTQSKSIGNAFVEVVQNDNVALEVQIYNNNLLVDNTAYTYTLLSVLPSKERIIRQGSIGPNGYPVFYLGVEEMSETGIILAMVQLYDELGNRVTSYDFKYRMKEDLSTGGVVPSADNPKFVIITEDSLNQTVQDAQQSKIELDEMKTDVEGVTHLTPNDRLVSDYNKINDAFDARGTFNALEMGGLNLIYNGGFRNGLDGWAVWASDNVVEKTANNVYRVRKGSIDGNITPGLRTINANLKFIANKEYTLSFKSRVYYSGLPNYIYILSSEKGGEELSIADLIDNGITSVNVLGDYKATQYSITFTLDVDITDGDILIGTEGHGSEGSGLGLYLTDVKLESGDSFTPWLPSLKDTNNQGEMQLLTTLSLDARLSKIEKLLKDTP